MASDEGVLSAYQAQFPARPDGPNARPVYRIVVTLADKASLRHFFLVINGRHFTQQWCLLENSDGRNRIAADVSATRINADVVSELSTFRQVRDVRAVNQSEYLQGSLGDCVWREAFNAAPFNLLADHVTSGSSPQAVEQLLGAPDRSSASGDVWEYDFHIGPHFGQEIVVQFNAGRVSRCDYSFSSHHLGIPGT